MKKLLFILLMTLLVGAGCSESEKPPRQNPPEKEDPTPPDEPDSPDIPDIPLGNVTKVDIPHYIMGFILPEEFRAHRHSFRNYFAFIRISVYESDWIHYNAPEQESEYLELCAKYGDAGYSKVRTLPLAPNYNWYCYVGVDIVSIDLVADQAWDDRPAGSSLADVCTLVSTTPRDYISSGYTEEYDWSQGVPYFDESECASNAEMFPERKPVVKTLSECEASDLRLISWEEGPFVCALYLPDPPKQQPSEPYNFTVIITLEDGRVFEVPAKNS